MSSIHGLYQPIKEFQTRIIRLHGLGSNPESALTCDLYTANILHPKFGVAIKLPDGSEYVTHFTALSYAWEGETLCEDIVCNGESIKITPNLHAALSTLRPLGEDTLYLWADALCIDQNNNTEKSAQVANIFMIYRHAECVIGWLGPIDQDLGIDEGMAALSKLENRKLDDGSMTYDIFASLVYIWESTWFKRIWVQQEVYAAQNLVLQFGKYKLTCLKLVSQQINFMRLRRFKGAETTGKLQISKKLSRPSQAFSATSVVDAVEKFSEERPIFTFRLYSGPKDGQLDLIDTILLTSRHQTSNPVDRIYGLLGMTDYPARPMPIDSWLEARRESNFIPIDYDSQEDEILCAVTWSLLMKGGLNLLAKFKVFSTIAKDDEARRLPSWVIDWQLTSELFGFPIRTRGGEKVTLRNMWDPINNTGGINLFPANMNAVMKDAWEVSKHTAVPKQHSRFWLDNRRSKDLRRLYVRGAIDPRFSAKDRRVWETEPVITRGFTWDLECDTRPNDIVVFLEASYSNYTAHLTPQPIWPGPFRPDGLWLLRPVNPEEYELVACLLLAADEESDVRVVNHFASFRASFHHWAWVGDKPEVRAKVPEYRRLAMHCSSESVDYPFPPRAGHQQIPYRTFTIV